MAEPDVAEGPRPLQRMVMVTSILTAAGAAGRPAGELATTVGFRGTSESRREQLARLIRDLQRIGVDIGNVAPRGDEAVWVLRPNDSRIRLSFTPEQAAELARAALLAGHESVIREFPDPLQPPPGVDVALRNAADAEIVLGAVASRSVLTFRYNGRPREVDPASVQRSPAGWTVTGFDRGAAGSRTFALARMTEVAAGPAGSAAEVETERRDGADPLGWSVDPPVIATLEAPPEYRPDVERLLGPARGAGPLEYPVTNRWVFLSRIVELGTRVRLTGPPELRAELRDMLAAAT